MANQIMSRITKTAVWKSIFRHGYPNTDRNRALTMYTNFFLHLLPVRTKMNTLRPSYTLGLGWFSFVLFLVLVFTGIVLMFYYVPSVDPYQGAYASMKELQFTTRFGPLMRNMHRWAAHLMVAVVFFHMCRVFFTGSYKPPREFNWAVGVVLLLITLLLSFTGYLLPWDQLAFWAITVGANIAKTEPILGAKVRYALLGGNIVGQSALLRFYSLHVVILPVFLMIFVFIHFWRIRKDGGVSSPQEDPFYEERTKIEPPKGLILESEAVSPGSVFPRVHGATSPAKTFSLMALVKGTSPMTNKGPEDTVISWPHTVTRLLLLFLGTVLLLMVVSYFYDAPLEEIANPAHPTNPAKAPWYFLGLQELVSKSAYIGGVVVPGLVVLALVVLPYVDRNPRGVGRWCAPERKVAVILFTIFVAATIYLIVIGYYFRGPNWNFVYPWEWRP